MNFIIQMSDLNEIKYILFTKDNENNLRDTIKKLQSTCLPEIYDDIFWNKLFENAYDKTIVVFTNDDQPIGFILATEIYKSQHIVVIASFGVLEKYRCHGVGTELLQRCITILKNLILQDQIESFHLHVRESNHIAIRLYEKFGFSKGKTIYNYYDPIDNSNIRENAIYMDYSDNDIMIDRMRRFLLSSAEGHLDDMITKEDGRTITKKEDIDEIIENMKQELLNKPDGLDACSIQ